MTKSEETLGRRIAKYRKLMGFSNTKELAEIINNPNISHAVISNIESGRRSDPAVSEILEISRGLGISPLFLLAPVLRPKALIDLPNVTEEMSEITSEDFLKWTLLEPSPLYRKESGQIALYRTLSYTRSLLSIQKQCERSRRQVEILDRGENKHLEVRNQAWEIYQLDLHIWFDYRSILQNDPLAELDWLDDSLLGDIDLDFEPSQTALHDRLLRAKVGRE